MAATRKKTTTTTEEAPIDEARTEDIRTILNGVDDPDQWLEEAYSLGVDKVSLFQRLPRSRAMPRRADLDKQTTGIERMAEEICAQRSEPGGRFVLLAFKRGRVIARREFDVGDPSDDTGNVPRETDTQTLDPSAELAATARDLRHVKTIQGLSSIGNPPAAPDPIQTVKAISDILAPNKGESSTTAAIITSQGTQITELMRMLTDRKESPSVWREVLAGFAPAFPGLIEMVAERFFGGGGTTISDESEIGKLDWGGWTKLALHRIISQNPELIQRVVTSLASAASGRPIQLPPTPGQPVMVHPPSDGAGPQPAAEEASVSNDLKIKKVRDYVVGRVLAVGAAKAEEDRGSVLRSLVAFLESLDPQGSLGIKAVLDVLPDMDIEAATLRLTFFDERFAEVNVKPGVEALMAYLREQLVEELETEVPE